MTAEAIGRGAPVDRLSCYIRTLNEATRIERVVLAAKAVAAEVVVVDSGSTDETVAIAEAAGARVVHQPWLGNGPQKRVGEEACSHDWLLDLDADEVVSPELADEVRALFANGEPTRSVHRLKLVTVPPFGEPWHDFYLAWRAKLYDRRQHRMPDHRAWDQLQLDAGTVVGRLGGAIDHHAFRDLAHVMEKLNKVSTNRARDGRLKPFPVVALRVVAALPVYFFKHYVLRGLWRGGLYGFAFAGTQAIGRWLRDAKMLEMHLWRRAER
ncbi:MAG: glycosyltransferase family 2 protein [Pseudomonadota bacterium]